MLDVELAFFLIVQPDVYSTPTILPCWSKATNRSGRIELRKGDFAGPHGRRELCFQLAACPGKTDFGPSWPRIDVAEDLFITMRYCAILRVQILSSTSVNQKFSNRQCSMAMV